MYRIMIVTSHRDKYESLYKYLTTTIDGETMPLEIETKEKLDERVEKMLNEEGYSKKDFIVVRVIDYTIDAKDYSDDENTTTETTPSTTDTTDTTDATDTSGTTDTTSGETGTTGTDG